MLSHRSFYELKAILNRSLSHLTPTGGQFLPILTYDSSLHMVTFPRRRLDVYNLFFICEQASANFGLFQKIVWEQDARCRLVSTKFQKVDFAQIEIFLLLMDK